MKNAIVVFLLLFGCSSVKNVNEVELRQLINEEENGLKKTIVINNIKVIATYKPADLLAINEINLLKDKSAKSVDSILYQYSGNYYFTLSFSINGQSVTTQVTSSIRDEVLNKFNYGLKENIFITSNSSGKKDTFQLSDYMYVNMYGSSNSDDVIISVNKEPLKQQEQFTINIKDLGDKGTLEKIVFETKDIEKLPKIKFNN